jgi:hypothetical protein
VLVKDLYSFTPATGPAVTGRVLGLSGTEGLRMLRRHIRDNQGSFLSVLAPEGVIQSVPMTGATVEFA